ncbi:MAG: hypothetical protein KAG97_08960, partial [Victivallales bacterium]|nr:hypothetical protein [Victivallales bacterium]
MKHVKAEIEGDGWKAEHAPEEREPFALSLAGGSCEVVLDGVLFGALREKDALVEKVVRHEFLENDGNSVDSESVIPFGVEPVIFRKFDYYLNTIRVTTDIRVKAGVPIDLFNVDDLRVIGDWTRFAVIQSKDGGKLSDKLLWKEIADDSVRPLWESDEVFAAILLENTDGVRLEIGTGFDLWRWNVADMDGARGRFTLFKNADAEIVLRRTVLKFETETDIPAREWRFTWYLAWCYKSRESRGTAPPIDVLPFPSPGEKSQRPLEGKKVLAFDLAGVDWPERSRSSRNGVSTNIPCLHAKAVRNHLRKTIRRMAATAPTSLETLCLLGCEPAFCDSAGHLERAKNGFLPHWALPDIIAFHFWASRLFRKEDILFRIIPSDSGIAREL